MKKLSIYFVLFLAVFIKGGSKVEAACTFSCTNCVVTTCSWNYGGGYCENGSTGGFGPVECDSSSCQTWLPGQQGCLGYTSETACSLASPQGGNVNCSAAGGGGNGSGCSSDADCAPCGNCHKVDPQCIGSSCEKKCAYSPCLPPVPPPTPTPTPIPVTIQGRKVKEPGGVINDPNLNGILVTLDNPGSSTTNNPYGISFSAPWTGGTRNVSVPATAPIGYSLMGYTRCYNQTTCHTLANVLPGNVAPIDDLSAVNLNYTGGGFHYVDLYWHYCQKPAIPTGVAAVSDCGQISVSWNPVSGATAYNVYEVDPMFGYINLPGGLGVGVTTTSLNIPYGNLVGCDPTMQHEFVVRAVNSCGAESGNSTTSGPKYMYCKPTAPNLSVSCVSGMQRATWAVPAGGADRYELERNSAWTPTYRSPSPQNATQYDDTDSIFGTSYSYRVRAYLNTNPAACQQGDWSGYTTPSLACYTSWFQVSGGDAVGATGPVNAQVPPGKYLDLQATNFTGISFGEDGIPPGNNLVAGSANQNSWLVDITGHKWGDILANHILKYTTMKQKVEARATLYPITVNLNQIEFDTAVIASNNSTNKIAGIRVWEKDGDITLSGFGVGGNKVLLFVNGNVIISDNITIGPGGMFTVIADGNINIKPTVGDGNQTNDPLSNDPVVTPGNLQGIYYAEGVLTVETDADPNPDEQLVVDGSLIGIGGVNLNRGNPGVNPSMLVRFNPGYTDILRQVGLRKKVIRELL